MKLIAQENFSWAHRGVELEHFEAGAEIETQDDDLIAVSTREGWAVEAAPPPASDPAGEVPADQAADAEGPDATQVPAAPKRGRAKQ